MAILRSRLSRRRYRRSRPTSQHPRPALWSLWMATLTICLIMSMVNYPQTFISNVQAKAWGDDLGLRPNTKLSSLSNSRNIVLVNYCPLSESNDHDENVNRTRSKNYYECPNERLGALYTVCCHQNQCCMQSLYTNIDGRTSYYIAMCSFLFSLLALFIFCLCSAFKWCPFFSFCEKEHLSRESKIYEMQQFRQNGNVTTLNGSRIETTGINNRNSLDDSVPVIQINDSPMDSMDYYNNHYQDNHQQQQQQLIIANNNTNRQQQQNHSTASLLNNVDDLEQQQQQQQQQKRNNEIEGGGLPMPSILVNPMAIGNNDVVGGANVVLQQQRQQQQSFAEHRRQQQQLNNDSYFNNHRYIVGGVYSQQQPNNNNNNNNNGNNNNRNSMFAEVV